MDRIVLPICGGRFDVECLNSHLFILGEVHSESYFYKLYPELVSPGRLP